MLSTLGKGQRRGEVPEAEKVAIWGRPPFNPVASANIFLTPPPHLPASHGSPAIASHWPNVVRLKDQKSSLI